MNQETSSEEQLSLADFSGVELLDEKMKFPSSCGRSLVVHISAGDHGHSNLDREECVKVEVQEHICTECGKIL